MTLPANAKERKALPVFTFLVGYFPDAFLEVVKVAVLGQTQHGMGEEKNIRWDRTKSTDQLDSAMRHMIDHETKGPLDDDGGYHLAKAIWRLSAELQLHLEQRNKIVDDYRRIEDDTVLYSTVPAPRPPNICFQCGADLEEGLHDYGCLTGRRYV